MVVLEGGGLLSSSANQYLQPDYLSPMSSTLDSKKSPLALLAQTCSQIGADTPTTKPLISTLESKPKKTEPRTSPIVATSKEKEKRTSPVTQTSSSAVAFKPYETQVTKKCEPEIVTPRPKPSESVTSVNSDKKSDGKATPSERKSSSPGSSGTSPIIRSGLEVLQGHHKDLAALQNCCPPGMESNPAFRQTLGLMGYPGTSSPYVSYARVKTPAGGETLVPVCKDPYCTGCQFSMHNQMLNTAGQCPSGCTQCDHQKYNLAMAAMLGSQTSLAPSPYSQLGTPFICNWIVGESYCGKRFRSSDELLIHLRTHTAGSESNSSAAAAQAAAMAAQSMLNPLFSQAAALQRFYPNPLSPLSAARYHPYAKPGLPPPSPLTASPYSAFNPALNPYYSPYLYGQRLGAAHP